MKTLRPSFQDHAWENGALLPGRTAINPARLNRRTFLRAAFGSSALVLSGCISSDSTTGRAPAMLPSQAPRAAASPHAISAIDTHIHLIHGNPDLKPIPEEMEKLTQSAPDIKARRLKMEMEQANVSYAFAMGRREGPMTIHSGLTVRWRSRRSCRAFASLALSIHADPVPLTFGDTNARSICIEISLSRSRLILATCISHPRTQAIDHFMNSLPNTTCR